MGKKDEGPHNLSRDTVDSMYFGPEQRYCDILPDPPMETKSNDVQVRNWTDFKDSGDDGSIRSGWAQFSKHQRDCQYVNLQT